MCTMVSCNPMPTFIYSAQYLQAQMPTFILSIQFEVLVLLPYDAAAVCFVLSYQKPIRCTVAVHGPRGGRL
jgi:hypothetical protein